MMLLSGLLSVPLADRFALLAMSPEVQRERTQEQLVRLLLDSAEDHGTSCCGRRALGRPIYSGHVRHAHQSGPHCAFLGVVQLTSRVFASLAKPGLRDPNHAEPAGKKAGGRYG